MHKTRLTWIDSFRGLGIIFVVLGHCFPPQEELTNYLYSFHIALFFFVSGYLLPEDLGNKELVPFFKQKVKRFIFPYFGYGLFTYLIWALIGKNFGVSSQLEINVWKPLVGLLYGNGHNNYLVFNIALWFLPALFSTVIIYFLITKYSPRKLSVAFIVMLLLAIGYVDSIYGKVRLPWGINISFIALVFVFLGDQARRIFPKIDKLLLKRSKILLAILLILTGYLLQKLNTGISFNSHSYGNLALFLISALSSIWGYAFLVKELLVNRVFSYLGKISLKIFVLHTLAFSLISAIVKFIFKVDFLVFKNSFEGRITYFVGSILIVVIYDLIVEKLRKKIIN